MNNKVVSVVFIMLILASALMLVLGNDGENDENRASAKLPKLSRETALSGEFAEGGESYVNDRIAWRRELIKGSDKLKELLTVKAPAGEVVRANKDMGTGVSQPSDLLVLNDAVMEMFSKKRSCSEEYAAAVSAYAEKFGDNRKIYSMLIPTRLEFEEAMYTNLQDSQKEEIDYIYSLTDSRVQTINVYDTLRSHSDEYIYFRSDHHWTMLGAYYGYEAFSKATSEEYVDIKAYEKQEINGFLGYLYSFVKTEEIKDNPDTIEWYDTNKDGNISWQAMAFDSSGGLFEYNSLLFDRTRDNYDFFLSASHPLACYTNSRKPDGRTILIIGDSYMNDFVPWIVNNYKNVVIINPRSYSGKLDVAIDKYDPDEIMIMDYIFTASFGDICKKIENLAK